jgi:hypothetical protein
MRLLPLALLAGCPEATFVFDDTGSKADTDVTEATDGDADTDSDTDADTDADTGADTGYALLYYAGTFTASPEGWDETASWLGWGYWGVREQDTVCAAVGAMVVDGSPDHECPQCEWTFSVSGPVGMTEEGAYCDGFAYSLTYLEGYFEGWDLGFAESYALAYGDGYIYLDETLVQYAAGYGFWPLAYRYNGAGRLQIDGDSLSFYGWSSYEYTYYYRY